MDSDLGPETGVAMYPLEARVAALEARVYAGGLDGVGAEVADLLADLQGDLGAPRPADGEPPEAIGARLGPAYTRLAAALTAWFSRPDLVLDDRVLYEIAAKAAVLEAIFYLSGFRDSDHLLELLSIRTVEPDGRTRFTYASPLAARLFTLFYTPQSRLHLDRRAFLRRDPTVAVTAYLATFGAPTRIDEHAYAQVQAELAAPSLSSIVPLPSHALAALSHLWMTCTYAAARDPHRIKSALNLIVQRWLERSGNRSPPRRPRRVSGTGRPTLLVASERFEWQHVMYRSYVPLLRQLRSRFRLVAMSVASALDDRGRAEFDEVVEVGMSPLDPGRVLAAVARLSPEVIYYPSLGMHIWTILAANLRLAPIQLMTTGHPATSRSPFMDYLLVPRGLDPDPSGISERVIEYRRGGGELPWRDAIPAPAIRALPRVLRIAVPSHAMKLKPGFMHLCRRLAEGASRRLEWHFFPAQRGVDYLVSVRQIRSYLPDARVHRIQPYVSYMEALRRCDVCLGSFPFGGASSVQDILLLAIPMVTLEGPALHQRTELRLLRILEVPEWLIAQDEDEYLAAAHQLIHNDATRAAIAHGIEACNPVERLLDRGPEESEDFADALSWLYRCHEAIQRDPRRLWTAEDRSSFEAEAARTAAPRQALESRAGRGGSAE